MNFLRLYADPTKHIPVYLASVDAILPVHCHRRQDEQALAVRHNSISKIFRVAARDADVVKCIETF